MKVADTAQAKAGRASLGILGDPQLSQTAEATGVAAETAALLLDRGGRIRDCNAEGEVLFKYSRGELVSQHVSMLFPQLGGMELLRAGEPNPRLRFLCRVGQRFEALTKDGESFAAELFLNILDRTDTDSLSLLVRPAAEVPPDWESHPRLRQAR